MNSFEKIVELFREFPGIGERQARRFAFYLLSRPNNYLEEFAKLITSIKRDVVQCDMCLRFFSKRSEEKNCSICTDPLRDKSTLMVVSKDADLQAIEKSSIYNGLFVVIGGLIPILEKSPETKIRARDFERIVNSRTNDGLKEVIFALSATSEGEHTREFLEARLESLKAKGLQCSELGRGLSTGTELEYADPETIKAALQNKK